jgi:Flp pilus assembly pilin Flp
MKVPETLGVFPGFGKLFQNACCFLRRAESMDHLRRLWREEEGQDIAEYAVMLAVILVIVVGTIRLIGSNANNVFSNVASSIQ